MYPKQSQIHAGSGGQVANHHIDARPKHPGVAALEGQVISPSATDELFSTEDVEQALKVFRGSSGIDVMGAMRETMMFTLKLAAINLDVHAE